MQTLLRPLRKPGTAAITGEGGRTSLATYGDGLQNSFRIEVAKGVTALGSPIRAAEA